MFSNLTIQYEEDGVITTLSVREDGLNDNLPYQLADMFFKVIRESNANPDIIMENLHDSLVCEGLIEGDSVE